MNQILGNALVPGVGTAVLAAPGAAQYRNGIDNEPAACRGSGATFLPSVRMAWSVR